MLRGAFACRQARRRVCTAPSLLPPRHSGTERLTLCLDLDETLIHTTNADDDAPNFRESSGPEAARAKAEHADLLRRGQLRTSPVHEFELPYLLSPVYVYKRPLLDDFLIEAAKFCELVLFSSAAESYVHECASFLDPQGQFFEGRLLTRQHCSPLSATVTKDLSRIGRPLERTVLVDDNVASFMLQADNGIPIRPFFGDPDDRELGTLLLELRKLHNDADVREHLRNSYQLREKLLGSVRSWRDL